MITETNEKHLPSTFTTTGVVLGSRPAGPGTEVHMMKYASNGYLYEAYAAPNAWLRDAVQGPINARPLRFFRHEHGHVTLAGEFQGPHSEGLIHLPAFTCPVDEVVPGIRRLVAEIATPPLRDFVRNTFERRDVHQEFWTMPASARHHHSRAGGLAVHTLEVAKDIAGHCGLDPSDRDLGIAGALLHDIGKVWCYTTDMRLNKLGIALGHEQLSLRQLDASLRKLEEEWHDGGLTMRCLLGGRKGMRPNGSMPSALLARINACDQRSCERDRARNFRSSGRALVWTPDPWQPSAPF